MVNESSWCRRTADGVSLTLQVQPRAKRTEVVGIHGDALKVRLQAPPVDGAANTALLEFLADALRVPGSAVSLHSGKSSRRKVVRVLGVSPRDAEAALLP